MQSSLRMLAPALALVVVVAGTACAAWRGGASAGETAATPPRMLENLELDVAAVIATSREGQTAKAKLRAIFEVRQRELNDRAAVLKKRREELEGLRASLSEAEIERRRTELAADERDLRAQLERGNDELATEQRRLTAPLVQRFKELLPKLGARAGAHAIYDITPECAAAARDQRPGCVAWSAQPGLAETDSEWLRPRRNITAEAVRAMDAESSNVEL